MSSRTLLCILAAAALAGCSVPARQFSEMPRVHPINTSVIGTFNQSVTLAAQGKYDEASAGFLQSLSGFENAGDADHVAETIFWLGFCDEKLSRPDRAARYYGQVLQRYPQSPSARQASIRLNRLSAPASPQP